jgi:ABC-type uncharacterized transport system auxiliary subunit
MPVKQYYVLNFVPSAMTDGRLSPSPYPFTLRLKELDIEEAYARPQIVYRQSPFELLYYNYKMWAVKPNRMVTDLILKQLAAANLVSHVVQRYDEEFNPDYELTGTVEAMEEYDSDQIWFAHLAIRFSLARLSDGVVLYSRQFDNRKRVFRYSPEAVVQELSATLEFIMVQALHDMDAIFAKESGGVGTAAPPTEVPK